MMELLAQVISTFIAIGVSFYTGYAIYLISSQANINTKIQEEANSIVETFNEYPSNQNPFSFYGDFYLLKKYKKMYPYKTKLELLNCIANDLLVISVSQHTDIYNRFSNCLGDNYLSKAGYIYGLLVNMLKLS